MACSILNREGNKISMANRSDRTGGGLALVYNNKLKVENMAQENLKTFEFAKWKIEIHHTRLTIVAIYRPLIHQETSTLSKPFLICLQNGLEIT